MLSALLFTALAPLQRRRRRRRRRPRCVAPAMLEGANKLQFFNSSIFLFLPFENFSDPHFSKLLHLKFDFIQEHENGAFFPMRKAEGE
jgi:hypothetical protein